MRTSGASTDGISFRSDDPDLVTETVTRLAPGVRVEGLAARGFGFRMRAWACGRLAFFDYAARGGRACFPEDRSYLALSVLLHGAVQAREERRPLLLNAGEFHPLPPGVSGEIAPLEGAHVHGILLDVALIDAHREASPARPRNGDWPWRLNPVGVEGRRLFAYLGSIRRELPKPTSPLRSALAAREVEQTLTALVAEACQPPGAAPAPVARGALAARAEELLAASLEKPVSLPDVARDLGTSVRTLSRTFLERRGMGPMTFLRQRRLEAARHDLFVADPGELRVTDVGVRYGFTHLGRFAVEYRRLFGESPSETLRC